VILPLDVADAPFDVAADAATLPSLAPIILMSAAPHDAAPLMLAMRELSPA